MEPISGYDQWDLDSVDGVSRAFNLTLSGKHLRSSVPHDDAVLGEEGGAYVDTMSSDDEDKGHSEVKQTSYGFVEDEESAQRAGDSYSAFEGGGYAALKENDKGDSYSAFEGGGRGAAASKRGGGAGTSYASLDNYAHLEDTKSSSNSASSKSTPTLSRISTKLLEKETARDWTSEWRALLSVPAPTQLEKLAKLCRLKALAAEFESAALSIVKTIVDERNLFMKTIKPIQAGGVAGGVKYLHKNIFLKFTLDQMGLYSGDEFSGKAAGRELSGLGAFLRWIVEADRQDLKTALFCIVDYAGWRVIASSLLPIGSSTLRYGSNDGGQTVLAREPAASVMRDAASFLNLKEHACQGSQIFGPADIEVHEGSDGILYILDTARVAMPEHPPKYFQALLIDCDGKVSPVDLPVVGYEDALASFIPAPHNVDQFLLGQVVSAKQETEPNRLVSQLLGAEAFGECLVIPTGIKGKYLYNLLRREFYQTWSTPLSSDAFSGFGRDRFQEHNEEIIAASMYLKSERVPRVVEYLDYLANRSASILDGFTLTRVLQERGVNMRLLGLVWARSQSTVVKGVVMAEMMTRAAKQLFRGAMRAAETQKQLRVVVVNTLNLLLGESQASISFYETAMQLQLRSKYGSYGEVFEAGADYRHSFDSSALFTRLTFALGIRFPELDTSRDALLALFQQPHPFSLQMPFEIGQRVKSLITDLDLQDRAATAPITLSASELETFRRSVASVQLDMLQRVIRVQLGRLILRDFLHKKKTAQPKVVQVARGRLARARTLLVEALTSQNPIPLEFVSAACHILADVCSAMEAPPHEVVAPLEAFLAQCNLTENVPLAFFAHERLVRAYHNLRLYDRAQRTAVRLLQSEICFSKQSVDDKLVFEHKVALTRRQCRALFGDEQILSQRYVGHVFGFLESEFDPFLERTLLPFEMALLPSFLCENVTPPLLDSVPFDDTLHGLPPRFPREGDSLEWELEYTGPTDSFPVECTVALLDASGRLFGREGHVDAAVRSLQEDPPRFAVTVDPEMCRAMDAKTAFIEASVTIKRAKPRQKRCARNLTGWDDVSVRYCLTCWPDDESTRERRGLCADCVEACHAGHTLDPKIGSDRCRCEIMPPAENICHKSKARSTCSTCWTDEEERKSHPICASCAAKCHVGHDVQLNVPEMDEDGSCSCADRPAPPAQEGEEAPADPAPKCLLEDASTDAIDCTLNDAPLILEPDLPDLTMRFQVGPEGAEQENALCTIKTSSVQPVTTPVLVSEYRTFAICKDKAAVITASSLLSDVVQASATFPNPARTKPIRTAGGTFSSVVSGESGEAFFCAVNSKGMTYTWGAGGRGQLGHGDRRDYDAPKVLQALTSISGGIKSVCCGARYALAFAKNMLFFWGEFKSNIAPFPVALEVPAGLSVVKVAANSTGLPSMCVVLFSDHSVRFLEEDKASTSKPPKLVLCEEMKDVQVIDVAAADEYVLFVGHDGSVYECGTRFTEPHHLLSVHGNLEYDEELMKNVANPTASVDELKVAMTPSLDMHLCNSAMLKLSYPEGIARVWASGKEAVFLSSQGELIHAITGGPTKSIPGRWAEVHSVKPASVIATRASDSLARVDPAWQVEAAALAPGAQRYTVRRVPNPADEGGEAFGLTPRDFSVHLAGESIVCEWSRPTWSSYIELCIVTLVLGNTDNNYPRNKKSDFKDVKDGIAFDAPEIGDSRYGTDGKERRVRLSLCEKHDCCTATASGYHGIPQALSRCFTCRLDNICAVCTRHCHGTHDIGSASVANGYCSCGTQSKVGCARRLSLVMLTHDSKKDTVLDAFPVRFCAMKDLPPGEIVVTPFRRKLISKVDQMLHLHLRLRTFGYKGDRPRVEIIPVDGEEYVARSDEVDDERACTISVAALTPGSYRVVFRRENEDPLDCGLVTFVNAGAIEEVYHPVDEGESSRLLAHSTWLANKNLKAKYPPSVKLLSVSVDASDTATLVAEVDLGGVLSENIDAPRFVVARRSQLPYCKSQDAALLYKDDIPEEFLGTVKHTIKVSVSALRDDPNQGIVLHVTTLLQRRTQLYCPIASYDATDELRALLAGGTGRSAVSSSPSTAEWPSGPVRPSNPVEGQYFFDTTLHAPVWFDGKQWITPKCTPVPK